MQIQVVRLLPAILFGSIILLLSVRPAAELPDIQIPMLDKLIHLAEYGLFSALILHGVSHGCGLSSALIGRVLLAGCSFAIGDELLQSFVPGRNSDPYDLIADALGALLGSWAFAKWSQSSRK